VKLELPGVVGAERGIETAVSSSNFDSDGLFQRAHPGNPPLHNFNALTPVVRTRSSDRPIAVDRMDDISSGSNPPPPLVPAPRSTSNRALTIGSQQAYAPDTLRRSLSTRALSVDKTPTCSLATASVQGRSAAAVKVYAACVAGRLAATP